MCRRSVALPVLATVLVLFAVAGCAQPATLTKGPYIQNPSPSAITVQWETHQPASGKVCFRRADARGDAGQTVEGRLFEAVRPRQSPSDTKAPPAPRYLYRARLLNLDPDTEYVYRVEVDLARGPVVSGEHRFRTWPETPPDRVTFIAYGDTRSQPQHHRDLARQFNRLDPAFILHNGDLVGDGNVYSLWSPEFFEPLRDVIDHVPMIVARGNHEEGTRCMYRFFDLPGGRLNYSFDYGPVHVVMLDMDKPTAAILQWLAKDLAAAKAPWKIAVYHKPTFNLGGHRSDEYRTTYLPLFEKYGVDVVVTGHSHIYERFVPLRREGDRDGRPILFITAGGGGAPLAPVAPSPLLAKTAWTYCYTVFTVTQDELSLKTLTDKGVLIDSYTVRKAAGQYDQAYLAAARGIDEAIVEQGLGRLGAPAAREVPTPDRPFEAEFQAAFPGLAEPVTLSVQLSEASQRHYVMSPAVGWAMPDGKEVKVRVSIRPRGKVTTVERKVYELRGDDAVMVKKKFLDPEIEFVVAAEAPGIERERQLSGVVYAKAGPPARPRPGPWAEPSPKKAPVGVTYVPPSP